MCLVLEKIDGDATLLHIDLIGETISPTSVRKKVVAFSLPFVGWENFDLVQLRSFDIISHLK